VAGKRVIDNSQTQVTGKEAIFGAVRKRLGESRMNEKVLYFSTLGKNPTFQKALSLSFCPSDFFLVLTVREKQSDHLIKFSRK
jgi:hypothetical protein